jgi:hypothetical protein
MIKTFCDVCETELKPEDESALLQIREKNVLQFDANRAPVNVQPWKLKEVYLCNKCLEKIKGILK